MQRIKCRVEELREYVDTIWHVALTPQQAVSFKPGQYLLVVMSDSDKRPFSIANSPTRSGVLELQIGATPENAYAGQVLARMREQGEIEIELAAGKAFLRDESPRPLILMAGGTGFSYARAILEYLIDTGSKRPVFLYWGVRQAHWLYEQGQMQQWERDYAPSPSSPWYRSLRRTGPARPAWCTRPSWMTSSVCMTTTSMWPVASRWRVPLARSSRCWVPSPSVSSATPTNLSER